MTMSETATSICAWGDEAFGPMPPGAEGRGVERALEELVEAFEAVERADANLETAKEELADVAIVLLRQAGHHRHDPGRILPAPLQQRVDEKMARNRRRRWRADGTGHGYHV